MTLAPLTNAPAVIQIHVAFAALVVVLTTCIFSLAKGSPLHRVMGWMWVASMAVIAISSFWIHTIRLVGPFSPIHLLSVFVLYALFSGVRAARGHRVRDHKRTMQSMVFFGLIVAGGFTFLPGRIMHQVLLGG